MILLNEIITDLVKEEVPLREITQGDIDKLPDLGDDFGHDTWLSEDPFELCEECQKLGYCRRFRQREIEEAERRRSITLGDNDITNLVPLKAEGEYYRHTGEFSKRHLQAAFDAFHQQDYETAIFNSNAVIEENKGLSLPYLVIAISQYFLGDYPEAINNYDLYLGNLEYFPEEQAEKMKHFIWHCENKMIATISTEETIKELAE